MCFHAGLPQSLYILFDLCEYVFPYWTPTGFVYPLVLICVFMKVCEKCVSALPLIPKEYIMLAAEAPSSGTRPITGVGGPKMRAARTWGKKLRELQFYMG